MQTAVKKLLPWLHEDGTIAPVMEFMDSRKGKAVTLAVYGHVTLETSQRTRDAVDGKLFGPAGRAWRNRDGTEVPPVIVPDVVVRAKARWGCAMRELVVLGTASQAPTRTRNQNGYFLRWDTEGILFDPGEGTQRQMLFAGVTASQVNRICVTHFHGDHCLGLPGVIQRMSLDRVAHETDVYFPADGDGETIFRNLRYAALYHDRASVGAHPIEEDGVIAEASGFALEARRLDHLVPAFGYRLTEPDGRRMLRDKLAAKGIAGPDIGRLQRDGRITTAAGKTVALDEVSEPRRGQKFAFVMDTRLCDAAFELADHADMLVCESTFAEADAVLAEEYGHLTARQAGRVARDAGVRTLVLTHFSQRYEDDNSKIMREEAAGSFGGMIVSARDLQRIPVPRRAAGAA